MELRYHIDSLGLSVSCNKIELVKTEDKFLGNYLALVEDNIVKARIYLNESSLVLSDFNKKIATKYYYVVKK